MPPTSLLKRWVAASRKQGALLGEPRGGGGGGEQPPEPESEQWLLAWWRKVCCRAHARGAGTPMQRYRAWSLREKPAARARGGGRLPGSAPAPRAAGRRARGVLPRSARTEPEEEPTQGRAGRYEVRGRRGGGGTGRRRRGRRCSWRLASSPGRAGCARPRQSSAPRAWAPPQRGARGGAAQKPPLWAPHEAGELFARPVAAVRQAEASMVAATEAGAGAEADEERPAPLPVAPLPGRLHP